MFSLMKKLEAVAIPALLTRSDLLPMVQAQDVASATCVNVTDEQEVSDASAFFFFMFMSFLFGVIVGCFLPWIIFRVKTAWAKPLHPNRRQIAQPLLLDPSDGWGTTVSDSSSSHDEQAGPSTEPAYDPFYDPTPEEIARWRAGEGLPHVATDLTTNFNGSTEGLFDIPLDQNAQAPLSRADHVNRVMYFRNEYVLRLTDDELDVWGALRATAQ